MTRETFCQKASPELVAELYEITRQFFNATGKYASKREVEEVRGKYYDFNEKVNQIQIT